MLGHFIKHKPLISKDCMYTYSYCYWRVQWFQSGGRFSTSSFRINRFNGSRPLYVWNRSAVFPTANRIYVYDTIHSSTVLATAATQKQSFKITYTWPHVTSVPVMKYSQDILPQDKVSKEKYIQKSTNVVLISTLQK